MKLTYHRAAEAELVAAARFYEAKVPGLGAEFLAAFEESVARIMESPARWPVIRSDKRRMLMPRFPYGLYYRVANGEVRILVIKHHSQHPGRGMARR